MARAQSASQHQVWRSMEVLVDLLNSTTKPLYFGTHFDDLRNEIDKYRKIVSDNEREKIENEEKLRLALENPKTSQLDIALLNVKIQENEFNIRHCQGVIYQILRQFKHEVNPEP